MKTKPVDREYLKRLSYRRSIQSRKSINNPLSETNGKSSSIKDELNKSNEKVPTLWGKRKVNCITPYTYSTKKHSIASPKKIFKRQGVNSFKMCLLDIMNVETSEEDFKSDTEEKMTKKAIDRMLTGWDDYGLHYLLGNINKSKSDFVLPKKSSIIPIRSWLHLHACKKCFEQFKTEWDNYPKSLFSLCGTDRTDSLPDAEALMLDKKRFSLFCESTYCYNATSDNEYNNQRFVYRNSQGEELEEYRPKMKCSEQYFRRIVYSYNACGLHYEFPDDDNKKLKGDKKERKEPELNPFMRVVVYGTDPCALNFPVELGGPDGSDTSSHDSGTNTSPSILKFEDSCPSPDRCQSSMFSDLSSNETPLSSLNKVDSSFQETNLTKEKSNYDLPTESKEEKSYVSIKNCPSLKLIADKICFNCEYFDDLSSLTTYENGDELSTICSLSDSDIGHSKLAKMWSSPKISSENTSSASSSGFKCFPKHSTNLKKIYNAYYPYHGKILEFSVYDTRPFSLKQNSSMCYHSGKLFKRKRRMPWQTCFSTGSIKRVNPSLHGKLQHISFQTPSTALNVWSNSLNDMAYNSLPYVLQACIYIFFFVFFVIAFLLIEDSIKFAYNGRGKPARENKLFLW